MTDAQEMKDDDGH